MSAPRYVYSLPPRETGWRGAWSLSSGFQKGVAVPDLPCPKCATSTSKTLDWINRYAEVKYYRCANCGHVWVTPKDHGAVAQPITFDVPDASGLAPRAPKTRENA